MVSSDAVFQYTDVNEYKKKIDRLIEGLLDSIDKFYKGKPSQAYVAFSKTMKEINVTKYLDKSSRLSVGNNLFRIRTATGNYPLSRDELFHIPFEKRGLVQTQRFSIPGLPSLYTANSIYVAWEEMRRPNVDSIQAIRLVNKCELRLLDITTDVYSTKENNIFRKDPQINLYKVLTWPLAACCSIKVKNTGDASNRNISFPNCCFSGFLKIWMELNIPLRTLI